MRSLDRIILALFAITILACTSSRLPRRFCDSPFVTEIQAAVIDPRGRLKDAEVPDQLRKVVIRYLWGEICGDPACELFPDKADVKACEEGYMLTGWILRKEIMVESVEVGLEAGVAVVTVKARRGEGWFSADFRRSDDGSWVIDEPLWKEGVGIP